MSEILCDWHDRLIKENYLMPDKSTFGKSTDDKESQKEIDIRNYRRGWYRGRKGYPVPKYNDEKNFIQGYIDGICALENAENGWDPRFG